MSQRFKLNYSVPVEEVMRECARIIMSETMLHRLKLRFSELGAMECDPWFFENSSRDDVFNKIDRTLKQLDEARQLLAEFDHMIVEVEPMLMALRDYYGAPEPEVEESQQPEQLELFKQEPS